MIQKYGVGTSEVLRRRRDLEAQSNNYWVRTLQNAAETKDPIATVTQQTQRIRTVTTQQVNAMLRTLLSTKAYVMVMSLPVRLAPVDEDELLNTKW